MNQAFLRPNLPHPGAGVNAFPRPSLPAVSCLHTSVSTAPGTEASKQGVQ